MVVNSIMGNAPGGGNFMVYIYIYILSGFCVVGKTLGREGEREREKEGGRAVNRSLLSKQAIQEGVLFG